LEAKAEIQENRRQKVMAISKRAKVRMKAMTQSERKAVISAAKKLYEAELMGPKRFMELQRFAKRC
jgi:hypothetical protein